MKECPKCAGPLVQLRSLNLRICIDCKAEFDWQLKPGQPPLINNNRADRMNQAATRSAARMNPAAVDELELNGWPERDDSPRQQRIEQGGELAEVYEVLDKLPEGLK